MVEKWDEAATAGAAASVALLDGALGAIAAIVQRGQLTPAEELAAVRLAMAYDVRLLYTTRHFATSPSLPNHIRAVVLASALTGLQTTPATAVPTPTPAFASAAASTAAAATAAAAAAAAAASPVGSGPDAIVIGSGVAGMTTALRMLDRGATVVLIEKEKILGGNSAKASSGINGCCPEHSRTADNAADSIEAFANDTARSAKREATGLISVLATSSASVIDWLRAR